jgi:hypothetical protein
MAMPVTYCLIGLLLILTGSAASPVPEAEPEAYSPIVPRELCSS